MHVRSRSEEILVLGSLSQTLSLFTFHDMQLANVASLSIRV